MPDSLEALQRFTARALRRRVGRAKPRKLTLEPSEDREKLVVLRIRYDRVIEDVVSVAVLTEHCTHA
jgi:hypothetical protein